MKTFPSKLFPKCTYTRGEEAVFNDLQVPGFAYPVSLYLSAETTGNTPAVENAAKFFDQAAHWNELCRKLLASFKPGTEERALLEEYCEFFRAEFPKDLGKAPVQDLVKRLRFKGMASHEEGVKQRFVVDLTLGYHQVLCMQFDHRHQFTGVSWDN